MRAQADPAAGPPILISSGGEQLGLRVVADHARHLELPSADSRGLRHKSQVLDGHCQAIGRDPAEIERSVQVIVGGDDLPAARRLLVELIEAGCTHLVLAPRLRHFSLAWLLEEIVDPVLDEVRAKS